MMRLGMLIDVDHMSQLAVDRALALADQVPGGGYPLFSGHNGVRGVFDHSERSLTSAQYAKLGRMHGMAGVGSGNLDAAQWLSLYRRVVDAMGPGAVAGFGTDTNGLVLGMPPRAGEQDEPVWSISYYKCFSACCPTIGGKPDLTCVGSCHRDCSAKFPPVGTRCVSHCGDGPPPAVRYDASFPASTDGTRTWDYNAEGVAHYGMLPDFVRDVASLPGGKETVDGVLMRGAQYFVDTWRLAETQSSKVP